MSKHLRTALWIALVTISVAAAGCGGGGKDPVVARVGHVSITMSEFQRKLNELPPYTKAQYLTPEGQIEFLKRLVQEEVLYQAAENAGYESDPSVTIPVEAMKRRAMIQAYYRDNVEKVAEVPEEDIEAYYNEYSEKFQVPARIRFRHIMTDTRAQALEARRRVMAGGEAFAQVAREMTTDAETKDAGGLTKSVALGRGLPRLGMSEAFIESLFDSKVGEVTEPLHTDKGWYIIKIEEKTEPGFKPLEEAREDIVQTLMPEAVRAKFDQVYDGLEDRYHASINEDVVRPKFRSEQEIFDLASDTEDPLQRLSLYRELLFSYPEGEHAAEAQFMVAFIYAEELKDYEAADYEFRKMLEQYPDSKLADSARWMLDNMRSEDPEFHDVEAVGTD
jgi:peptidyl-prolyl cis-trans isomerase C